MSTDIFAEGYGMALRCQCGCRLGPQDREGWSDWFVRGGAVNDRVGCDGCDRRWMVDKIQIISMRPEQNHVRLVLETNEGKAQWQDGDISEVFHVAPGRAPRVDEDTFQAMGATLGLAMEEAKKWKRRAGFAFALSGAGLFGHWVIEHSGWFR